MPNKPNLVLFDVDDTLAVTRMWRKAMEQYCAECGITMPEDVIEAIEYKTRTDDKGRVIFRAWNSDTDHLTPLNLFTEALEALGKPISFGELRKNLEARFPSLMHLHYEPYEGAADFIRELRAEGVKIGFITSAPRPSVEAALQHMGMYEPGSDVLFTYDEGVKRDNKHEYIEKACAQLNVKQDKRVWFVGNDMEEMGSALRAGCTAVAYGDKTSAQEYFDFSGAAGSGVISRADILRAQYGADADELLKAMEETAAQPGIEKLRRSLPGVQIDPNQIARASTFTQMSQLYRLSEIERS